MGSMRSSHDRHRSVDNLRALAAVSVLISHAHSVLGTSDQCYIISIFVDFLNRCVVYFFRGSLGGGNHPGVVTFIVLSGFCIHGTLARAPDKGLQSNFWVGYAIRRFVRIYPTYLLGIVLGLCSLVILNQSQGLGEPPLGTGITQLGLIAKIFILNPIIPGIDPGCGNIPLETVATEMWLYAAYPVLFLLTKRSLLATTGIVVLAYFLSVVVLFFGADPVLMYSSFPRFLLYWVLGAVVAELFYKCSSLSCKTSVALALVMYAVLFAFNNFIDFKGAYLIRTPIMAVFVSAALLAMLKFESTHIVNFRIFRLLAWIGERSYSLYVVHMPIMIVIWCADQKGYFNNDNWFGPQFFGLFFSALFTLLFFRCLESPSHALAQRLGAQSQHNDLKSLCI